MELERELAAGALIDLLFDDRRIGRCLVAPDGSVLRTNAEWLRATGKPEDQVLGEGIAGLFPDGSEVALALHTRPRAGHTVAVPPFPQRAGGRETWWEGSIAPVPMAGGTGLLITLREAPAHADGLDKDEFLATLSHELRNPLAAIRNSAYLLEHATGGQQSMRAREVVHRQAEHLMRLVDDLLDITRISRGKIALQRSRVDLRDIVRKTTDDLRSTFEQNKVELRVELRAGPVWVDADETRMAQVVTNLLHNAVKFTPDGGRVTVGVMMNSDRGEILIRDTGAGIEPDEIERMFEPFVQADHSLARTRGGLGLGLALVKGVVELHGGTVRARSEGFGRGAEFLVALPLSAAGAASPEAARGNGSDGRLVLIIEDNVDAGQSLADILELDGYRVRLARDGRSGIELARALRPDVILCDIGLPDLDGYAVARALRRDEALRATRLVAVSGYAQPEDRKHASEAGFDAHVAKPPPLDQLSRIIEGQMP